MPTYAHRRFDGKDWSLVEQPSTLVKPPALHTLTQAAELAREASRLTRREAPVTEIVAEHPKPWRRCDLDTLPSAAQSFARWAQRAGLQVAARECGSAVQVGCARDGRLVLRVTWTLSATTGRWTAQRTVVDGKAVTITAAKALVG